MRTARKLALAGIVTLALVLGSAPTGASAAAARAHAGMGPAKVHRSDRAVAGLGPAIQRDERSDGARSPWLDLIGPSSPASGHLHLRVVGLIRPSDAPPVLGCLAGRNLHGRDPPA